MQALRESDGFQLVEAPSAAGDDPPVCDLVLLAASEDGGWSALAATRSWSGRLPATPIVVLAGARGPSLRAALKAGAFTRLSARAGIEEGLLSLARAAEHSRLRRAAEERRGESERTSRLIARARMLEAIQRVSTAIISLDDLDEILLAVCRAAVELFAVDHSALVLFPPGGAAGQVVAEYPPLGTRGLGIPVSGVPAEEALVSARRPLVLEEIGDDPALGPVRAIFRRFDIRSILIVPVVFQGRTLGSFSLDAIGTPRRFDDEQVELCALFAVQVAVAVEHATLLAEANRRADQLETVRRTTLAITSQRDRDTLLQLIVRQAVALLGARIGGVYEHHPLRGELRLVADEGSSAEVVGTVLRVGEGMAGRLIESGEPFLIVDDYHRWEGSAPQFAENHPFGAVIEVPLKWQSAPIGVLYVGDSVGRAFTAEDARLLEQFADHAAIAIANADLAASEAELLRRLERVAQASSEIMDRLGEMSLPERLQLIVRHATEILEAEHCDICLVHQPGLLSLEASYGHVPGMFQRGRTFPIRSGPRSGLTGHIAYQRELFNMHGEELQRHHARRGEDPVHLPSRAFHSLMAIPLLKRSGDEEELVGLLRADNKRDRFGQVQPAAGFSAEDEYVLRIFADAAVVAIEDARLVHKLRDRTRMLELLLGSSPNGIIAVDTAGHVTDVNRQAQAILGYRSEEIAGRAIDLVYADPGEARRVGALLHAAPEGKLAGYMTQMRSKEGETIPIRLTASWLHDARDVQIGSVGYFEDLRAIREAERRLELLLQASRVVAQAENLADGLQRLARMVVELLGADFCRIFLLDPERQLLEIRAIYPATSADPEAGLVPRPGLRASVDEWPNLAVFLASGGPLVLRRYGAGSAPLLAAWADHTRLDRPIESMLIIPLRAQDRAVGLLDIGDLRGRERALFSDEQQDLVRAIADQTAVLIDQMQLHDVTERRRRLLTKLDRALRLIQPELEPVQLYQQIARLASSLIGGAVGGLCTHLPHIGELELLAIDGTATPPQQTRQPSTQGLLGSVARRGETEIAHEYGVTSERDKILAPYGFTSAIVAPLKNAGEVEEVLFVADRRGTFRFDEIDQDILERFAARASLVLRTARLVGREQRLSSKLSLLHQMGRYVQSCRRPDAIAHVLLTAITAGYGLSFNRAALLRLDERREHLVGVAGIGQLDEQRAARDWEGHHARGLEDFQRYLCALDERRLDVTPIGARVTGLRLPLAASPALAEVVRRPRHVVLDSAAIAALPGALAAAFEPAAPAVIVPLVAAGQVNGLVLADNRFTRAPITTELLDTLLTFADSAAVALANLTLLQETERARELLSRFYEASNDLATDQHPRHVLHAIVERARAASGADGVSLILFDEQGRPNGLEASGLDGDADIARIVRPNGLSTNVLRTGRAEVIDDLSLARDRVNPIAFERGLAAGMCLPIAVDGQRTGVVWFHYRAPHAFGEAEVIAAQLYANQAALTYNNALRIEELRKARNAAHAAAEMTALEHHNTLEAIVRGTREVLGCDAVSLFSYDQERDQVQMPPIMDGVWFPDRTHRHAMPKDSIVYRFLRSDEEVVVDDAASSPLFHGLRFHIDERIVVCIAVPLRVRNERVGVMFINYRRAHRVTDEERANLRLYANQAAVAIRNARLYAREQRRAEVLQALYDAGRAVTASLDLPGDAILEKIFDHALNVIQQQGRRVSFASIRVVEGDSARLVKAYPPPVTPAIARRLDIREQEGVRIGVIGRAIKTGATQRLGDVLDSPDYVVSDPRTQSELAVPIVLGGDVIGVINVEHSEAQAFDRDDQQALEMFASQAAIVIQNARLYAKTIRQIEEIERTKEMLAARTDVAWMGMVSSTWRHAIQGHAQTIVDSVDLLRTAHGHELPTEADRWLQKIRRMAGLINEKRMVPPLEGTSGAISIPINTMLRERLDQLWKREPYAGVEREFAAEVEEDATVRISPEWLRIAFDYLVDNAIQAMRDRPLRRLTVSTRRRGDEIEIAIEDSGCGIPPAVRPLLLREPIPKKRGERGMGMGLLLARTIAQTYGGDLMLGDTSPEGTRMIVRLPLEAAQRGGEP